MKGILAVLKAMKPGDRRVFEANRVGVSVYRLEQGYSVARKDVHSAVEARALVLSRLDINPEQTEEGP